MRRLKTEDNTVPCWTKRRRKNSTEIRLIGIIFLELNTLLNKYFVKEKEVDYTKWKKKQAHPLKLTTENSFNNSEAIALTMID